LAEVSAGGGTIAWLDAAQTLRTGPMSAGADPGPACYGVGSQPTVTDANVVLGRLDPRALLGGSFPIDAGCARRAVATVAGVMGGDLTRTAAGIVALIDAEMAKVLRIVSVERGYDPRDFTLLAFGGGGPLHACAVAREIGVRTIVIPALPGVFSAYGLLTADVRVACTQSYIVAAGDAAWPTVERIFAELHAAADTALAEQDVAADARAFSRELDLRYAGQSFELTVGTPASAADAIAAFHARHQTRYGFCAPADSVQIVTVRVIAVGTTRKPALPVSAPDPRPLDTRALRERREVWADEGFTATPVYAREGLAAGDAIRGPAIIEQYDATSFIAPGWDARVDEFGQLIIIAAAP
jgi:N-methylhydantoinase A